MPARRCRAAGAWGCACLKTPLVCLALLLTGCAHYEYDIVRPPDLAGHIGENADTVFALNHLVFHLRSDDNYLVIRIHNPGDDAVRLLGGQSVVVDPRGQSHPLMSRLIAPQSWIKLILPPMPPPVYPVEPVFGFGFGFGGPGWYSGFSAPLAPWPRYYPAGPYELWDWPGQTNVRLTLTFQRASQPTVSEHFVFHRQRM